MKRTEPKATKKTCNKTKLEHRYSYNTEQAKPEGDYRCHRDCRPCRMIKLGFSRAAFKPINNQIAGIGAV
ncbi:MAG: hypothetical protein O2835_09820 [Proteobacteria bacterium]|nr:hypothetical protein [Pseudomonadota bacterium]MDA0961184.1 hypothetical protein [Pseudomonadota bacterium]